MKQPLPMAATDQPLALEDPLVVVTRAPSSPAGPYGILSEPIPAPELPGGQATTAPLAALRQLFRLWGLDTANYGTPAWNPLGAWIFPGARVTLKPNWVLHENQSGQGMDCLVTHPAVIESVLEYVLLARPGKVVLGDAPVQGCDLPVLLRAGGIEELVQGFRQRGLDLSLADFRRTILDGNRPGAAREENRRSLDDYVLFDLANESLLEPLTTDAGRFRVTMYNPALLGRTHQAGRHQYLVARAAIDCDVFINLPKLKAHKKACITGALKNLVGINGNKEFLPHHRKGGSSSGGDCYAGGSRWKRAAEECFDWANRLDPGRLQGLLFRLAGRAAHTGEWFGADNNMEGSWYGNDTVWRTCLDLQRILHYGCADATLSDTRQRRVLHLTDAIVGGEGEGPLASTPVAAGWLSGATNAAAAEWAHARLMGFDPARIPLLRGAFGAFRWPLAAFPPQAVRVRSEDGERSANTVFPFAGRAFVPPRGWRGHCELPLPLDPIHVSTSVREPAILA